MSRIITELTCKDCNEKWNGYISFGHPEEDYEHKWVCEKCGSENSATVKAWVDLSSGKSCNDEVIYKDDPTSSVRIFTSGMFLISKEKFEWKDFDDEQMAECLGGYLTLEDISDQIQKIFGDTCIGVIYVWVESPLHGIIYQFGNHDKENWYRHGKTNGYA